MKINSFITRSLFLIFVSIFTSSDAVKETVSHGSTNNHASLILELIKRLGQPSYNYQSADEQEEELGSPGNNKQQSESASNDLQSPSVCDHVVEKGSIIKTTESINAGAFYIDSVKYVKSNADCMGYCCQNSTCDVAVYQDKGDRYCYLFSCAGRCIFKSHTGYFVGTIKSRKSAEHPEEDLQNLNDEVTGNDSGNKKPDQDAVEKLPENQKVVAPVAELTTVKMVATTQNETPELVIAPHSVGLSGFCTLDGQCEDLNAVCSHENCVCKDTFYNKDGLCRKICIQSEFECFELGTLVRGPECVSKSRVCDLYLNCADGSDEFNCEKTDFPSGMRPPKSSTMHKVLDSEPPSTEQKNIKEAVNINGQSTQAATTKSHASKLPLEDGSSKNKTGTTTSPRPATYKPFPENRGEKKHIFLSSEKVIIANTSDAEGPIIALSLGLAFTLILLVLVGCRLRNVRHRLRKGRPLHQNEADYLINGMYL